MPDNHSLDQLDGSADSIDRLFDALDARYGAPDPPVRASRSYIASMYDDLYDMFDDGYPIGGIPDDDYDDDPEWDLFLADCERDDELEWCQADADEAELYDRLERPRKRRQAPLPTNHAKRRGHFTANRNFDW